MDYATHTSRAAKAAKGKKAAVASPQRGAVPAGDATQARCGRGIARPIAGSPSGNAAHAFLKLCFLPHCTILKESQVQDEENQFYGAFGQLCDFYSIAPMATRHLGYPYGREVALWDARRLLRSSFEQHIEISPERNDNTVSIAVTETYNTGNTLYYIPVVPLYHLMRRKADRKPAELLLSVCAYLWQVAGVPYYRDEGSYLSWQYEMIGEWVEGDPEGWGEGSYWQNRSQLHTATHIGDVMQRRLWHHCHLDRFAQRVAHFMPLNKLGCESLSVAEKALSLCRDYPAANLYRHADTQVLPLEDECYDESDCITMDKYIGFCAETKGWLYHTLSECVNGEFGEYSQIQQPVLHRCFGKGATQEGSLDFECRLFEVIDGLCTILNDIDYGNE